MSLNLGTLTGFLDLDTAGFDKGLDGAAANLKGFGGKGAALAAGAGVAVGAALAAGVLGAMNVESANDKLAAQLGLTAQESERIGGVAGSLYADAYGSSLEEVNTAVGAVVSSISGMRDASSADVEAMSAKVLDLATGFEVDVTRAAQVAGQMITSGLAGDGAEAMDLLVASMQAVPAAVREDLMDAVDEYGPFMQSLGLEGEAAMGLLVASAEKGAFGIDKTGDALKEFTIRATDMSKASGEAYDALGLSQEDMTTKLLAGGDTAAEAFDQIVTGLQGIEDPAAQSQAALALFGTPLEDLSVQEIPAFLDSLTSAQTALGDTAGAADDFGTTLNGNAATSLTSLKRQAEQAVVGLANGLLPAVTGVTTALAVGFGPAADMVADAVIAMGRAIPVPVLQTAAVVVGALTAVLLVQTATTMAASAATGAYTAVKGIFITTTNAETGAVTLSTAARIRATATTVLATAAVVATTVATGAYTAAQWLLNAALSANPLGIVILALTAIAAGLVIAWKNSESFRDIVTAAFGKVLGAVSAFLGVIEAMLRALGNIPGFGWADTAASKVAGARDTVDSFARSIRDIPASKLVTVTTRYIVTGNPDASIRGGQTERAGGGPVSPYSSYLVGEHGPELLTLGSVGGKITPSGATQDLLAQSQGSAPTIDLSALISEVAGLRADVQRLPRAHVMNLRAGVA